MFIRNFSLFLLSILFFVSSNAQDCVAMLKKMHDRYAGKWTRNYTFSQTTEMFRSDTLRKTETWYEAISYPDKFRMDFGPADSGNAIIYNGDSSFLFHKMKLVAKQKSDDNLTFLLGGMYYYSFPEALERFKSFGFDVNRFHNDVWNNKPMIVIGALKGEDSVSQLWYDATDFYLVRMIEFKGKTKEEGFFENQIRLGNSGWSETTVRFYINNKLIQRETYHDCKARPALDKDLFNPAAFGKIYWHVKKDADN